MRSLHRTFTNSSRHRAALRGILSRMSLENNNNNDHQEPRRQSRWMDRALVAMLALSLSLNAALVWKMRRPTTGAPAAGRAETGLLAKGALLPAIEAVDVSRGSASRIAVSPENGATSAAGGTLLYVFASQCGWCERNHANFQALADGVAPRYRVVALALDEGGDHLDSYIRRHRIAAPVYHTPSPATFKAYNLGATPGLIVISPDGRVDRHWLGAWNGKTRSEVEAYFDVKLPGVATAERQQAAAR